MSQVYRPQHLLPLRDHPHLVSHHRCSTPGPIKEGKVGLLSYLTLSSHAALHTQVEVSELQEFSIGAKAGKRMKEQRQFVANMTKYLMPPVNS